MLKYAIREDQISSLLRLMSGALDVRIVFYDMDCRKLDVFDVKGDSGYCRTRRKNKIFDQQCMACDRLRNAEARDKRRVIVYECHNGLLEGVVPLFDESGTHLGAIVTGQIRQADKPALTQKSLLLQKLYDALPCYTRTRVRDICEMLGYLGRYILQNHLIQYRAASWTDRMTAYIADHLAGGLTIAELAAVTGTSVSFVTHRFREEFGMAPRRYILQARMKEAQRLLEGGMPVKEAAFKLGFCDEFHFSKTFKTWHGASPSTIKKP